VELIITASTAFVVNIERLPLCDEYEIYIFT